MKKKLFAIIPVAIVAILGVYFLWPLSFSSVIKDDAEMIVSMVEFKTENGISNNTTIDYTIAQGSEKHAQIRQIIDKRSYHRSIRTLFNDGSTELNTLGYSLYIFSGAESVLLGGTSAISVNGKSYRIGYFGNTKALEMMDETRGVLEAE